MRVAVIGIGSNSVRMLTAQVENVGYTVLFRERAGTRLFNGLDASGCLSEASMAAIRDTVRQMTEHARAAGVEQLHIFATSAVRDAGNQEDFSRMILETSGSVLEICTGEREAALSYLGAADGNHCGVIDIGGGSTEYVIGKGKQPLIGVSAQMGAVRFHKLRAIQCLQDLDPVVQMAESVFNESAKAIAEYPAPKKWIGVGGTFTSLAAMIQQVDWRERETIHGSVINRRQVEETAYRLAQMSVEERKQVIGLQPHRADIVVHGICILLASMKCLGIDHIELSVYGNLDGYVKDRYIYSDS